MTRKNMNHRKRVVTHSSTPRGSTKRIQGFVLSEAVDEDGGLVFEIETVAGERILKSNNSIEFLSEKLLPDLNPVTDAFIAEAVSRNRPMVTYEVRRDPSAPRSTIVDTPHLTRNRSRKRKKRGAKKGTDADKPTTSDASEIQKLEPEEISQDAIEESISPLPDLPKIKKKKRRRSKRRQPSLKITKLASAFMQQPENGGAGMDSPEKKRKSTGRRKPRTKKRKSSRKSTLDSDLSTDISAADISVDSEDAISRIDPELLRRIPSTSSIDEVRRRIKRKSYSEPKPRPLKKKKKKKRSSFLEDSPNASGGNLLPPVVFDREPKVSYDFENKFETVSKQYRKSLRSLNVPKHIPKKNSCGNFNTGVSDKINTLEDQIGEQLEEALFSRRSRKSIDGDVLEDFEDPVPHVDFALDLIRIVYFLIAALMTINFDVFGEMSQELDNWGDMRMPYLDEESEGWE